MNTSTTTPSNKGSAPRRIDILALASGLRCKSGALAIVVQCGFPEALGAIVEMVCPYGFDEEGKFLWDVKTTGRSIRVVDLNTNREMPPANLFAAYDYCLRPLRGDELEESTEESDVRIAEQEMH
jgi:hypothetical protein